MTLMITITFGNTSNALIRPKFKKIKAFITGY